MGSHHQVNFIGDNIVVKEFMCADQLQSGVEELWSQLPDVLDEPQAMLAVPAIVSALSLPLSILCADASHDAPVWNQLQGSVVLEAMAGCLTVYTDGSLQGSGTAACCSGVGMVVLDRDRPVWEVAV